MAKFNVIIEYDIDIIAEDECEAEKIVDRMITHVFFHPETNEPVQPRIFTSEITW